MQRCVEWTAADHSRRAKVTHNLCGPQVCTPLQIWTSEQSAVCAQVHQSLCASKTQGCRLCMPCTPSSVYSKQTSKLSHLSMSCSIPTCTSHSIAHQSLSQYNAPEPWVDLSSCWLVVGYSTQCAHECPLSTILLSSPYLHAHSVLLSFSVAITSIDIMCQGAHGHSYAITSCTTLPLPLGIKIISNSDFKPAPPDHLYMRTK